MTPQEKLIWDELNAVRRTKATTPFERNELMYQERALVNQLNPNKPTITQENPPIEHTLMRLFTTTGA